MNDEIDYQNNPLHGVSLKNVLTELVSHYGFKILFAYLNINCFKTNPSIESSLKFLKKTDWAREKVESFYLYELKNLPRATDEQFELPPRDRIIPEDQSPGEPAELSMEDAERLNEKRARKSAERDEERGRRPNTLKKFRTPRDDVYSGHRGNDDAPKKDRESSHSSHVPVQGSADPWAKWRK